MHASYERLIDLARKAHQAGRSPRGISSRDVELARLYCHAYRGHVIGAFHAARQALGGDPELARAGETLADLADRSMDPIVPDVRALLSTLHHYHQGIDRVLAELAGHPAAAGFRRNMARIMESNGIHLTRDIEAPEDASFIVPGLGIRIVPLVYGDFHSWNLAYLAGQHRDVPCHLHHEAVEIHLGYSPVRGQTILGSRRAAITEGYAMPIPPGTVHGYVHQADELHHVPFIYGSFKAGGWGVFLDVDPQPRALDQLEPVPLDHPGMNGSIPLEREIARAASGPAGRRVLIPASATDRGGSGGLELGIVRVDGSGFEPEADGYRIVSVIRGQGSAAMAGADQAIAVHDHLGIPAGMACRITAAGSEPLVLLDALLK